MKMSCLLPKGFRQSKFASMTSIGFVAIVALMIAAEPGIALAKAPLGRKWPAAKQVSIDRIDHSRFDILLRKYVDSDGYVDYATWKKNSADRRALQKYLTYLSQADPARSASRPAKLAFWINAYNAVTIEGIFQVYPTKSIRDHTARVFGYNIWQDLPLQVGDGAYSLEQMEHEVLRKMKEPRVHFAIVCASVGCPRLLNEAYSTSRLEQQLSLNTRDFFSRRQNFRADVGNGTIYVSSILSWFGSDFGRSQVDRFRYLREYLPENAQRLALKSSTTVRYLNYDWDLNDQSRRKRR